MRGARISLGVSSLFLLLLVAASIPATTSAQSAAVVCPAGKYLVASGSCVSCVAGTYSATVNATTSSTCQPCPSGSYSTTAGSTSCTACPIAGQGTVVASAATSASQCAMLSPIPQPDGQCLPGTFKYDDTQCIQCPGGTASSATGATSLTTCTTCPAGTYAPGGSSNCVPCPKGAYNTQSASSTCQSCIPGTYADAEGSSSAAACRLCPVGTFAPQSQSPNCTVCPRKTNATKAGSFACSECATGYARRPNGGTECWRININQCSSVEGQGGNICHRNAICTDMDDGLTDSAMYSCSCPPGMLGDGIGDCAVFEYETKFVVSVAIAPTETVETFNVTAFKILLYETGVIAASIPEYRVVILVSAAEPTTATGAGRRLLQAGNSSGGVDVGVSVMSSSEEEQQAITATINTTALASVPGITSVGTVSSAPPDQFMPTVTESPGFSVDSVQFDDSTARWNIDVSYTPNIANTITSLYVSKPGTILPVPQTQLDTYMPSMHPCALSTSVCCLANYKSRYIVGAIASNFSSIVGNDANGVCTAGADALETLGMFDPAGNAYAVENALVEYPDSSIVRISDTQVRLRIAHTDLVSSGLAIRTPTETNPAGYELSFFVGMTFMTMLPANALGVVVSQYAIKLAVVNSVTFSFASQKDFTMIRYVMLSVLQNKWIDGLVERRLQMVQMGVVLPFGTQQNMATGLVPLTSVRFAISQSLPDRNNASQWTNPCFSSDNTGMYDPGQVSQSAALFLHFAFAYIVVQILPLTPHVFLSLFYQGYYSMYTSAGQQMCAARYALCTNPAATLTSNLVNFFFPIGDRTLNDAIYAAASTSTPYNIYVTFQVSVIDSTGQSQIMSLFASAPIRSNQVSRQCETVSASGSLLDTTSVDVAVGFVGTNAAWNSTMVVYRDVLQATRTQGNLLETTRNITAKTIPMGMVTLVIKGSPTIFNKAPAANYFIDVEQMATMHFLDSTAFNTAVAMIRAGTAYTMIVGNADGRPRMEFTSSFSGICGVTGLKCQLFNNIYAKSVQRAGAVHPLSTGFGTTSTNATRDWLMQNILRATDEYTREISANMTELVRSTFGIDDRVRKAWFVNPAVRWVARGLEGTQSELLMSDKLIVFAVITLNDRTTGNVLRRRLLSFSPTSSSQPSSTADLSTVQIHEDFSEDVVVGQSGSRKLLQQDAPTSTTVVPVSVKAPEQDSGEDVAAIEQGLKKLANDEREGTLPPIQYDVNIAEIGAAAYGIQTGDGENQTFSIALRVKAVGRFDDIAVQGLSPEQIGDEFYRRLAQNKDKFCPDCQAVLPFFNNFVPAATIDLNELNSQSAIIQPPPSPSAPAPARRLFSILQEGQEQHEQHKTGGGRVGRRALGIAATVAGSRHLLQSSPSPEVLTAGTYTALLVYSSAKGPTTIYLSDIAKAVYKGTYTPVLDMSSTQYSVQNLMNAHFIIKNVDSVATDNVKPYM